jgi:hypothetical protein
MRSRDLAVAFIMLNAADCFTTLWVLEHGGRELNPLMALLLGASIYAFIVLKLCCGFMAGILVERHRPNLLKFLVPMMAVPVVWNLFMMANP